MFRLIEEWLFNQLGLNVNFTALEKNNIFRDGCVLVNLLQKYGLVNESFCACITPSTDKQICKQNLKLLKPVFDMLSIKYNQHIINDIVEDKTGTILNLFYDLYICFENKQHLYFITRQNYEKICQDAIKDFDVPITISKCSTVESEDNAISEKCLHMPLIKNRDIIEWYKKKYETVRNNLNNISKKTIQSTPKKEIFHSKLEAKNCNCPHRTSSGIREDLPELDSFLKQSSPVNLMDYDQFIASYKSKLQHKESKKFFETCIQNNLLQQTWSKIVERQNEIYNSVFSNVLLKQSQYEKQILTKLILAQKQTDFQTEDRIYANKNVMNEEDNKVLLDTELKDELEMLEKMYQNERKRVLDLHKKLYKEKKDLINKNRFALCKDIVYDIFDLAICCAEYKSKNGVEIHESLWKTWAQLFIEAQPVHIQLESLENVAMDKDIDYDDLIAFEMNKDEILNENDLDHYLFTSDQWFYEGICLEYKDINEDKLAFIVYRLLSKKYPLPPSPSPADLPHYTVAGVLLNFYNISTDTLEKLKSLLSKANVHVFNPDLAIKQCIAAFQRETAPPAEESTKGKKKPSKSETSKQRKGSKRKSSAKSKTKDDKVSKKKNSKDQNRINDTNLENEKIINVMEKETQTSVVIETEETEKERTSFGLLGEEVFNKLKGGEPLDDSLLISVIIHYLKSLEDCNGWLLLNYPQTIQQASGLELVLTGKKIPLQTYDPEQSESSVTLIQDEWREKRVSKLLNFPITNKDSLSFKSYFTVFIKIKEKADPNPKATDNQAAALSVENEPMDNNELEDINTPTDLLKLFYSDQCIYHEFFADPFDVPSLKSLARIVLNEYGPERKSSNELFGEDILNKLMKGKKQGKASLSKKKDKNAVKGKKGSKEKKSKDKNIDIPPEHDKNEEILNVEGEIGKLESEKIQVPSQETIHIIKEPEYISLPINDEFAVLLATMWENIESSYLNNLKLILFENKLINMRLYPYSIYVKKEVEKVMAKPDLKQNIINIFQEHYNNINNDLRTFPEMKNQLNCRVFVMQQSLWKIADERKQETEARRQTIIHDNWLVTELCMLMNNYLSLVQVEFERSLETLKLVSDYYMSMLDKSPLNITIRPDYLNIEKLPVDELLNTKSDRSSDIENRSYGSTETESHQYKEGRNNFIAHSLICCHEKEDIIFQLDSYFVHKAEMVQSNFKSILQIFNAHIKLEHDSIRASMKKTAKSITAKEDASTKTGGVKSKLKVSTNKSSKEEEVIEDTNLKKELLIEEWISVVNTESERFNFRFDLIHQRARINVIEFYCFLETVFCEMHDSILSNYNSEISNIDALCDYIKTAIEEESPLLQPLLLIQNKFYVELEDTEGKVEDYKFKELREEVDEWIFTVEQLSVLMNIFNISGPQGVIRKQPLCLILKDLMLLDTYNNIPYLPKIWNILSEPQMRTIMDKVFGPEYGVDWREFIIYNLDVPYPKVKDLLQLRKRFLIYDAEETEVISLEDYEKVTLWFEEELPDTPLRCLRYMLVKKLLSKMFMVDKDTVNYTALLLYFCKDHDSILGLGKALSLSMGKYVIMSKEELQTILQDEKEMREIVAEVLSDIINSIVYVRETAQIHDILSDSSSSICQTMSESSTVYAESFKSGSNELPSDQETNDSEFLYFRPYPLHQQKWVTKVPLSCIISVLNSTFFFQDKGFTLLNEYLTSLEDEADDDKMIEASDLVNVACIQKLFTLTNKFKIVAPCDIIKECVRNPIPPEISQSSQHYMIQY